MLVRDFPLSLIFFTAKFQDRGSAGTTLIKTNCCVMMHFKAVIYQAKFNAVVQDHSSDNISFSDSVIPLLKQSIGILMQRTPPALDHVLPQCYQRVQHLQGVYSIIDPHFWTLCSEVYIGTVKLLVAPDADARWILSQTHNIFTQAGVRQLYVQIDFAAL
ncbi:hypothetical protein chiPu_0011549 [Chiloscyllium punctatum]|uniref:Zinc transporter n=1 Tax=Chiloscyllium punctatum TaxID=137246 RepID=A0A401SRT9_CHIPU|nr:hypothetical protein [Chiloscyllium punctatum]